MRSRAFALALLLCSGATLAQNPLGDDSGPNAHDGQCDDTRFENIGAGNSNIVSWEGGRYNGRDATDCRELLLLGLINWRDGVDARVDELVATGDLGDDSGPNAHDGRCDDTRFENIGAGNSNIVFWEGGRYNGRDATDCADLLLQELINWRDGVGARVDELLATGDFGDDSGPNAHDGRCDDTRFENNGAGNSNIVFWEGARYDDRDATDCADLLLQGLIAWRGDTAVAGVPAEPEIPTVTETQQQQATDLPEGVTANSICTGRPEEQACWMQLEKEAYCYVWNPAPLELEFDTWSGQCTDGFGTGTVVYGINGANGEEVGLVEVPYVSGKIYGTEVVRGVNGTVVETPYVNGEKHGLGVQRGDYLSGYRVIETAWVNGRRHGVEVERWTMGSGAIKVTETPYVDGVIQGTVVQRMPANIGMGPDAGVVETPHVDGQPHGLEIWRYDDGSYRELPYVRGEKHGLEVQRMMHRLGGGYHVIETPWVNGQRHGTEITRWSSGAVWETPYVNGHEHGTHLKRRADGTLSESVRYVNGEPVE